jgi:nickel/cobalt exporter
MIPVAIAAAIASVLVLASPAVAAGPVDWVSQQWTGFSFWVMDMQRQYHRELVASVRAVKADASIAATWTLVLGSFVYGVFHAAGPGHGKAILLAYLLTHESRVARGLWIALASALVQGVTAIVLVEGARALIGWSSRDAYAASSILESVSYGLIAALGAMLAWRGILAFARSRRKGSAVAVDHHVHAPVPHDHAHDHGHVHDHDHSGHVHFPMPDEIPRQGWRTITAMILSIGIRPCSGAVLVLIVAGVMGLRGAGMLSVLAMSLGTAVAVAALAFLAVGARNLAAALASAQYDNLTVAANLAAAVGGTLIALMGVLLLWGSLGPAHPLLP